MKRTVSQHSSEKISKKRSENVEETASVTENNTEIKPEDRLKKSISQDKARGGNS